jgi:hypothetical protein
MRLEPQPRRAGLSLFGFGMQLACFAVMLAESLSGPPRAPGAVRAVVVAGLLIGSVCVLVGVRRQRVDGEAPS